VKALEELRSSKILGDRVFEQGVGGVLDEIHADG